LDKRIILPGKEGAPPARKKHLPLGNNRLDRYNESLKNSVLAEVVTGYLGEGPLRRGRKKRLNLLSARRESMSRFVQPLSVH